MKTRLWLAFVFSLLLIGHAQAAYNTYDGGLLIDNNGPEYSETGEWADGADSYYVHGHSTTRARASKIVGSTATFKLTVPEDGVYRIYWWRIRKGQARIEIDYAGGSKKFEENMQSGHYGWWSLGDYRLTKDEGGVVRATVTEGTLYVDSVKLVPAAQVVKPVVLPPYPEPDGSVPRVVTENGGSNLYISGKPRLVLYQQWEESTCDGPEDIPYLDEAFDNALKQGVNTIGCTLTWKRFEPKKGQYDFRVIDALIENAKARRMHLSIVWFGSWRNLQSYYAPRYVYEDRDRFFTAKKKDGSEQASYRISPFCMAAADADARALRALLGRVQEKDPDHQVVVLMQVENEMPGRGDYSKPGQEAWNGPVPRELHDYIQQNQPTLEAKLLQRWTDNGKRTTGTWEEVFGDDGYADRIFGAYYYGRYIERVISQAKQILDLPMYCNAWAGESPCDYRYMDVFHAAVPSLEGMGPDAYGDESRWEKLAGNSVRPWNALVIPEQHHSTKTIWKAFGTYGALLNGEYHTVEGCDWLRSREAYAVLSSMTDLICARKGTKRMLGFFQQHQKAGESWNEEFLNMDVTFTATVDDHEWSQGHDKIAEEWSNIDPQLDGCGLMMQLAENEYVVVSTRIDVTLQSQKEALNVVFAERGHFEDSRWIKDGEASIEQKDGRVTMHFPKENKTFGLIRIKLGTGGK